MIRKHLATIVRQGNLYRKSALENVPTAYPVSLMEIADHPGLSQDQLAQLMGFDKSNAARRVAALEAEGVIVRTPSPRDKRVMELRLTPQGEALLPPIREALARWDKCLTQDLSNEERALLDSLLARMEARAMSWSKEEKHV